MVVGQLVLMVMYDIRVLPCMVHDYAQLYDIKYMYTLYIMCVYKYYWYDTLN